MISQYDPGHSLSILADRASIGLSLLRKRQVVDDLIRRTVDDGVRFCRASLGSPPLADPAPSSQDGLRGMNLVIAHGDPNLTSDTVSLKENLIWLQRFFDELSKNEGANVEDIDRAQDELDVLSKAYYDADLRTMRREDASRGLDGGNAAWPPL